MVDGDAAVDSVEVDDGDGHGVVEEAHGAHVQVGSRAVALVELQDNLLVDSALVDTLDRLDSLADRLERLDSELVVLVVGHMDLWAEHMDHGVAERMGREPRELVVVHRGHEVVGHMDHAEVHMDHEHRGLVGLVVVEHEHMDPAALHTDLVHTEVVGMLLSQVDSLEVDKPALGVDNWAPQADSSEVGILEAGSSEEDTQRDLYCGSCSVLQHSAASSAGCGQDATP